MPREYDFKALDQHIEEWRGQKGALMPVMHAAQELYGCLDESIQLHISENMNIPMSEIYGVATFYSRFTLQPRGRYTFGVCLGTACYVRGAQAVYDEIVKTIGISNGQTTDDGLFTLEALRCIGCCGLAPAMMVNGEVYGAVQAADIPSIVDKYRQIG